jgi:hypothetical protein
MCQFPETTVLRIFMKMLLIVLHYHLTKNLFKICSLVSIVDFGVIEALRNQFLNFVLYFDIIFVLYVFPH